MNNFWAGFLKNRRLRAVFLILIGVVCFSACTDQDGVPVDQAVNSQTACETSTQTFDVSVVGLGDVACTQTALKDSALIGLLLLSGLDVSPNDTTALDLCDGQLLLDIACNDPANVVVFHEKCTIEKPKPICTTDISTDEILLNAIANALGVTAGQISNSTLQNALTDCGVSPDKVLITLTDTQIQCVEDKIRASLNTPAP